VNRTTIAGDRGRRWDVLVPTTLRERVAGLRRLPLGDDQALLIPRCRSIHTAGMPCPIAVAFLDRDLRVLRVRRIPPGRLAAGPRGTRLVMEFPVGADVRPGDRFTRRAPRGLPGRGYTLSAVPRDVR
jgi:uncharacterized membrane protein (UPF0127 family)